MSAHKQSLASAVRSSCKFIFYLVGTICGAGERDACPINLGFAQLFNLVSCAEHSANIKSKLSAVQCMLSYQMVRVARVCVCACLLYGLKMQSFASVDAVKEQSRLLCFFCLTPAPTTLVRATRSLARDTIESVRR
jgi:hypothetical protein